MPETPPALSLVVACYNEAEHLETSVARVLDVCDSLAVPYEVIFVDDGSTDGTRRILDGLSARYPDHRLRFELSDRNRGRGATVSRGLTLARAPVAGFLD